MYEINVKRLFLVFKFNWIKGAKMEDKTETIRIQTDGAKQTVGIHTDITFEIDDKKNATKSSDGKNAESSETDDEVPVYRGTHTEGERDNRRRDPNYYMNGNFHGTNDDDGIRYSDGGNWVRFLPMANGGWTTERYSETFNPQSICICRNNVETHSKLFAYFRSTISIWWFCTIWYWQKIVASVYMWWALDVERHESTIIRFDVTTDWHWRQAGISILRNGLKFLLFLKKIAVFSFWEKSHNFCFVNFYNEIYSWNHLNSQ